jgi:hypothetical protein
VTRRAATAAAAVLLVVAGLLSGLAQPAAAQGRSLEILSAVITARVNPDGSMDVVERLAFDFDGDFNGGTRDIPRGDYRIVDFAVTEDGDPRDLAPGFGDPNSGEVRWFGSADHSQVSGRHTYELSYTVLDAVDVFPDVGVLNWQFIGFGFPELGLVTVDVTMPGDGTDLRAFAHGDLRGVVGIEGSTVLLRIVDNPPGSAVEARITVPSSAFTVPPTGSPALPGILAEEAVLADTANAARARAAEAYAQEVRLGSEPGCDQERSDLLTRRCDELDALLEEAGDRTGAEELSIEDAERFAAIRAARQDIVDEVDRIESARQARFGNIAGVVVSLLALGVWYATWYRFGKEPKVDDVGDYWREVPVEPPAVVAAIDDWGTVRPAAFATTILDLAQRGWLTITEEGATHRFTRSQQTTDEVPINAFEHKVLWRLFPEGRSSVTQDELVDEATDDRTEAAAWMTDFRSQVGDAYNALGYHDHSGCAPWFVNLALVLVTAATTAVAIALGGWVGAAAAAATTIALLPLALLLRRRSAVGARKHAEVAGLRAFLRDFSLVSDVPVGHLALYERYLVYAVALGVADKLVEGLKVRFPQLADPQSGFAPWYVSSSGWGTGGATGAGGFDKLSSLGSVGSFADQLSSSTASAFSPPSSSSGGGGGFSGGGGGGFSGGGGGGSAGGW